VTVQLYVHALRAARPRQLARRATRPVRRRLFPRAGGARLAPLEQNAALWASPAFAARRSEPGGLLADFTANYGEDVLAAARAGDAVEARRLAERWLDSSPPRVGAPWHPYVVSTRVANWIAAATLAPALASPRLAASLHRQVSYLARNVEDDILGNHVIRNAKALVLGGEALGDERLAARGRRLLARELPEQVLGDGGHYERSPAYHRLVLLDLLELAPFAPVAAEVAGMRAFATASSRPDGAPALFNDGGLDVAPPLELHAPADGLEVREQTGYAFVRRPGLWLALDCGAPSPPFLPAHAHADALSFQLWADGAPLVVDPGTSTYDAGAQRDRERGTEAHATVAVGGDQFRLWGAFRSGPLPRVRLLDASPGLLVAEAALPSGVTHRRTIRIDDDAIAVEDVVGGRGSYDIVSSLPLAPGADLDARPLAGEVDVEPRTVAERFGERRPSTALVQRVRAALPWEGGWELRLAGYPRTPRA
jgi:hypothetical protein